MILSVANLDRVLRKLKPLPKLCRFFFFLQEREIKAINRTLGKRTSDEFQKRWKQIISDERLLLRTFKLIQAGNGHSNIFFFPEDEVLIILGFRYDSLALAETYMALETEFKVNFSNDELLKINTMKDFIRYLSSVTPPPN